MGGTGQGKGSPKTYAAGDHKRKEGESPGKNNRGGEKGGLPSRKNGLFRRENQTSGVKGRGGQKKVKGALFKQQNGEGGLKTVLGGLGGKGEGRTKGAG